MKKILIVNKHYYCGGIRRSLDNLLPYLLNKYEVKVLFLSGNLKEFDNKYPGIRLNTPFIISSCLTPYNDLKKQPNRKIKCLIRKIYEKHEDRYGKEKMINRIMSLSKTIKDFDCVISYTHDSWDDSYIAGTNKYVLKNVKAINKIAFIHGEPNVIGLNADRIKEYYSAFNSVVLCSDECKKQFDNLTLEKIQTIKINPIINQNDIKSKLSKKIKKDVFTIVTVSRMTDRYKRIDKINDIVLSLKEKGLTFKWIVVGGGVNLEKYIKDAKDRKLLNYVEYVGYKDNPYEYMLNADLVVITSDSESFSYVLRESLIVGTPILTTNFNSVLEIIQNGINGYIVDKDVESLANGIERCIKDLNSLTAIRKNISNCVFNDEKSQKCIYSLIDKNPLIEKIEYLKNPKLHPLYDSVKEICIKYKVNDNNLKCLDVGSGRGLFQELINDYTGLDLNEGLKSYYQKPFVVSSMEKMPFKDDEFDLTFSIWALEHVDNIEEALNEIRRVTKNGGHIILAPAFRVRPWAINIYKKTKYKDLDIQEKFIKLYYSLLNIRFIRAPFIFMQRLSILLSYLRRKNAMPLRYGKIRVKKHAYSAMDIDACNFIDRYALIKWFESKGCICVSHKTKIRKFFAKKLYLDFINVKNAEKLLSIGNINNGVHLRRNLEMFESLGMVCRSLSLKDLLFMNFKSYDVLYLNWYENINETNIIKALLNFVAKVIVLKKAKRHKLKIINTKHNIMPHDGKYLFLIKILYRMCFDYADRIVCFTSYSAEDIKVLYPKRSYDNKICIINPVNYTDSLPLKENSMIDSLLKTYEDKMIITLFGWIKEYKNPLLLIKVARELKDKNIQFVIIGQIRDEALKSELIEKSKGLSNITLKFERIDDGELHSLVDKTTIFVTPYDKTNASNSGVGRLAFSYGKTVISSNIASIKVLPKELVYSYDYLDDEDHYNKLKTKILEVYDIYSKKPAVLKEQGQKLKKLMDEEYSFDVVKEKYRKLFNDIQ